LAGKVRGARGLERVERHIALHRQHDKLAELGRVGEASSRRPPMLRQKILQLAGIARAERDLMAVFDKPGGERLGYIAGSQNPHFHIVPPPAAGGASSQRAIAYICAPRPAQKRANREPRPACRVEIAPFETACTLPRSCIRRTSRA